VASQARAAPAALTQNNHRPSSGIIGQIINLVTRPALFFHHIPQTRQWLWAAVLILVIFGYAASNQTQSSTETSSTTTNAQGFDLSLLQIDPTTDAETLGAAAANSQTTDSSTNATLTSALLAACGVLVMWAGQSALLCLVPMLRGHPPNIGRSLQIAVWASLPLALMLGLRQLYFTAGGTGGSVGFSLLLEQWDTYDTLPETVQRILAVFTSNITLFWLWSLVLLYFGARYALHGRRWSIILVLLMWITASTVVPALLSEPVTTTAPRVVSTETEQSDTTSTEEDTNQSQFGLGGMGGMGGMPSGEMPSGGGAPPGGGGFPGG
jgi:uncharacterized membrane protein YgcG